LSTPAPSPVETVPIARLFCSPTNPRNNDAAIPHVAASLRRFGWQQPVVAKRTGEVIAGNTRLKAAQELGMTEVPVWWFDGNDLDATAFSIADNRTHEFAAWNDAELAQLLEALRAEDALDGVGYSTEDIDALVQQLRSEESLEVEDDTPAEPPAVAVSRPGDLWVLGNHRLLCGDSTVPAQVARLLGGATPFLMVTDPPYGVSYDPEWREECGLSDSDHLGKVRNDDRVDWTDAYRLFPGTVAYVWHAGKFAADLVVNLRAADFEVRAQIIWRKPSLVISRGHYHWQHEPCWYAVRSGQSSKWCGDRSQSTVWDISNKIADHTEHSTQKPVECMARPIRNHGSLRDDVYDPFLGSGTTLIACEHLGRRCFGLELDPRYCDVIVARWEKASGKQATLDGDGRTFADVSAERMP
jgi:DNA modification methylase